MNNYKHRISLLFQIEKLENYVKLNDLLLKSCKENISNTISNIFYMRDPRNGKGLREAGRHCYQQLMFNYPNIFKNYIKLIPKYGRWDDLYCLFPQKTNDVNKMWIRENFRDVNEDEYIKILDCQQYAVNVFIDQLKIDYKNVTEKNNTLISFAAKWALNEKSSRNQKYKHVSIMCDIWGINKREYRKIIVTIRRNLNIVEHYICEDNIKMIDYTKLSDLSIVKYYKLFTYKDYQRFFEFLIYNKIKKSILKKEINMPFDIILPYSMVFEKDLSTDVSNTIEQNWDELLQYVQSKQLFKNSLVVADNTGSMYQQKINSQYLTNKLPLNIAISFAVLIARSTECPYHNMILNYSVDPTFTFLRKDESLLESLYKITSMKNTILLSFFTTLHLILQNYILNEEKDKKMITQLIIFSDKTIQEGDPNFLENLKMINEKYKINNQKIPNILYFHITNKLYRITDIPNDITQIYHISGFSYDIFNLLVKTGGLDIIQHYKDTLSDYIEIQ